MKEPQKWIDAIVQILNLVFGGRVPPLILRLLGYILLLALVLLALWGLLYVLSKIKVLWVEQFWPLFYDAEERRRGELRRRFADHVSGEIRRLNRLEQWSDHRFAELEAEVEAEGDKRSFNFLASLSWGHAGLRRERSLSKALESSQERLILLEGEPGCGKSVALRHVAESMATRAMKAKSTTRPIPIFVNLREMERPEKGAIDSQLIRTFILQSLNRANDRDIEAFLDDEFEAGLKNGTWLFLFDSFDELPDILSSVEADKSIRIYAEAIADFLSGFNQCRGVIASRQFRGPGFLGWPRFRILGLSPTRQSQLIHRAALARPLETELIGRIEVATDDIRTMASNPMFLGLLMDHVRSGNPFPDNVHIVFEKYVQSRLERDQERVNRRFGLQPGQVREVAEHLAFCMAADPGLGLNPVRERLKESMKKLGFHTPKDFEARLDALEFIKLARSETEIAAGDSRPFTFAHRRFQEYFATCIVLRDPGRVNPRELLTDGRWRETAVVLCQTQKPESLEAILEEAQKLLSEMVGSISAPQKASTEPVGIAAEGTREAAPSMVPGDFPWPSKSIHLLSLLQDGFQGRADLIPEPIRSDAGHLVDVASKGGTTVDEKWALEVAGIATQTTLLGLLRDAFPSDSQWLREVAYRQAARLIHLPNDIASSIRMSLVRALATGRLFRERVATRAHLARLDRASEFISATKLLIWLPYIDLALQFALCAILIWTPISGTFPSTIRLTRGALFLTSFYFLALNLGLLWVNVWRLVHWRRQEGPMSVRSKLQLLFYVLYVRFMVICVVAGLGKAPASINLLSVRSYLVLLVCWYLTSWGPLGVACASSGEFTNPPRWPLIPFSPLFYFLRDTRTRVRQVPRLLRGWGWAVVVLPFLPALFTLPALNDYLSRAVHYVAAHLGRLFYVFEGLFLLLLLPFVVLLLVVAFDYAADLTRWRGWLHSARVPIDQGNLLQQLLPYRTDFFRARALRSIRQQGRIVATSETEEFLKQLALSIEARRETPKNVSIHKPLRWGPEPLDEIYKLLEQIKANSGKLA